MAQKSGKAGKSTYQMADRRGKQVIWILVIGLASLFVIYLLINKSEALGLGGGAVIALLILLRVLPDFVIGKAKKKEKEEHRAIRGARAEEKIESLLDQLGDGYMVLHDVDSPYGNIDHLVISRYGGIFLVETKAHGGKITVIDGAVKVNGHDPEKDFIAQCLRNAFWVRDSVEQWTGIRPWITPLLVFTNAFVTAGQPVKNVRIINKKYLLREIEGKMYGSSKSAAIWDQREILIDRLMSTEA